MRVSDVHAHQTYQVWAHPVHVAMEGVAGAVTNKTAFTDLVRSGTREREESTRLRTRLGIDAAEGLVQCQTWVIA